MNPLSISLETSIDKGDYYLVYNFEYNDITKCYVGDKKIHCKKALEYAKYNADYECRYYKDNTKKIQSNVFENKDDEFFLAFAMCTVFATTAYIFGK